MLAWSNMGEDTLRCSFNLSPKVIADSPMYFSTHSSLSYLYLYITLLFWMMFSLSLGATRRLLMVLPPLKWTWYLPYYKCSWYFCWDPWYKDPPLGCYCGLLLVLLSLVLLPLWLEWTSVLLCLRLFKALGLLSAHVGYLKLVRAFLMCSSLLRTS